MHEKKNHFFCISYVQNTPDIASDTNLNSLGQNEREGLVAWKINFIFAFCF